jgi:riboflavin synthase
MDLIEKGCAIKITLDVFGQTMLAGIEIEYGSVELVELQLAANTPVPPSIIARS